MYLLHVSTGLIYSSAFLFAIIFLLAIQDAYSLKAGRRKTYGYPAPGSSKSTRHIHLVASHYGEVTYRSTLSNIQQRITCINFVDNLGNQPRIWISKWPPCHKPVVMVSSPPRQSIDMKMEIYFDRG